MARRASGGVRSRRGGGSLVALALAAGAVAVFVPIWAPLVLAAWTADLARPIARHLERVFRGRRAAAGVVTVLLVLAIGAPLALAATAAVLRARALVGALLEAAGRARLAAALPVGQSGSDALRLGGLAGVLRENADALVRMGTSIASASAAALLGVLVFVVALYGLSADGRRVHRYVARRVPIDARLRLRLVRAFRETGRGLFVGAGGTALAQAAVATAAYAIVGVGDAGTLGLLTGVASFVPGIGTALVWGPLAAVLFATGHPMRAVALAAVGVGVIATIDNLVRPLLVRAGRLELPVVVVFLSMVGGLRLVGPSGLLLGPLVVRLAVEALDVARERGAFRDRTV